MVAPETPTATSSIPLKIDGKPRTFQISVSDTARRKYGSRARNQSTLENRGGVDVKNQILKIISLVLQIILALLQ